MKIHVLTFALALTTATVAQTNDIAKTAPPATQQQTITEQRNDFLRNRNVMLLEENIALIKLIVEMGEMNKSMRTRLEAAEAEIEKKAKRK